MLDLVEIGQPIAMPAVDIQPLRDVGENVLDDAAAPKQM